MILRLWVLLMMAIPGAAVAQSCGTPPKGSGGDWFRSYQNWCRSCGGTPSANASPATCTPGPNWSGGADTGSGAADLIGRSIEYGAKTGDTGGALLGVGAGILIEGLLSTPTTDPGEQERKREAQRHEALLRAQELDRRAEASKQRITASLKGVDTPGLGLKGVETDSLAGLKLGDQADGLRDAVISPPRAKPAQVQVAWDEATAHYCESKKHDCMLWCACGLEHACARKSGETSTEWNRRCNAEYRTCSKQC